MSSKLQKLWKEITDGEIDQEKAKKIFSSNYVGSGVLDLNPDDINRFFKLKHPNYPSTCTWVEFKSGEVWPMSIYNMKTGGSEKIKKMRIKKNQGGTRKQISKTLRDLIKDQIMEFKNNNVSPEICPITNKQVVCNIVDHNFPIFRDLMNEFSKKHNLSKNYIYDYETHTSSFGEKIDEEWRTFHKKNANLRLVSNEGNIIERNRICYNI